MSKTREPFTFKENSNSRIRIRLPKQICFYNLTRIWWETHLWIPECSGHQTKFSKTKKKLSKVKGEAQVVWWLPNCMYTVIKHLICLQGISHFLWFLVKPCPLVAILLFGIENNNDISYNWSHFPPFSPASHHKTMQHILLLPEVENSGRFYRYLWICMCVCTCTCLSDIWYFIQFL